jgi:hypothetical protein
MRLLMTVLVSCAFAAAAYCASSHEITDDQARALVSLAFAHQVRHIKHRGTSFLYPDPANHPDFDPRYYDFDVDGKGWTPPGIEQEGLLGRFAVNKMTGQVWNTYGDCSVVSFAALRKLQNDIRRRDGLSAHEPPGTPHRGEKPRDC